MTALRRRSRPAALVRATSSAALLAGLLIGMPYALTRWGRGLLPEHLNQIDEVIRTAVHPLPSTAWTVLVLAGWLIWAVLCGTTVRELAWHARHLPRLLRRGDLAPVASRKGIAGVLVAAIVLGVLATQRAHAQTPAGAILAPMPSTRAVATAPAQPGPAAAHREDAAPSNLVVRQGDTLWDLARRHLGDPLRWREIYHLNHGVPQADGRTLSDPDLICPGWTLQLPSSTVQTTGGQPALPLVTSSAPTPAPVPVTATSGTPPPISPPTSGRTATPEQPSPRPSRPQHSAHAATSSSGVHLPAGGGYIDLALLAALTALAGRALARRRARPHAPRAPQPYEIPEPTHPEDDPLTCALRQLHRLNPNTLVPSAGTPVATDEGRTLNLGQLLARAADHRVALTGPGAADVVRAMLATAITAAEAGEELVISAPELSELAPALTGAQLPRLHVVPDAGAALTALEAHALRAVRTAAQTDVGPPPRLVLIGALSLGEHERLTALLRADQANVIAAVHPDPLPGVWEVTVDPDGHAVLDAESSGTNTEQAVRFFHLRVESAETLLRLVRENIALLPKTEIRGGSDSELSERKNDEAEEFAEPMEPPDSVSVPSRAEFRDEPTLEEPGSSEAANPPRAPASVLSQQPPTQGALVVAPVRLTLLGQLAVTVRGVALERGVHGNVGDLLAYLAVHRNGKTKEAITTALWPAQATADGAAATFDNTKSTARTLLRSALGSGRSLAVFVQAGGIWRLDPQLYSSDLDDLREAFQQAHAAGHDRDARLDACRQAVALAGGVLHAASDAEWLEIHREDLRQRTLDALAVLTAQADQDPEETLAYLTRAVDLDPYNEQLYLRQARLHAKLGRPEAVRRTLNLLKQRCQDLGVRTTPAVIDAFQQLLAGPRPTAVAAKRPVAGASRR
ncbi:LysM peptidoglycan-binding domain-containing protein [Streptacidiphilus sp. MAP5-3]|uniref:LysM peptidoglycan-binding domain-containing protein n=1 Tax=unclassified Streptacidiphilus TaxID=2643834 RepID=UPI0035116113